MRGAGPQISRPSNRVTTPDTERAVADIRRRLQKLDEDLQVIAGKRGPAGKPEAAVRNSDLADLAADPIADPSSELTSGPADATYSATEQDMLNELNTAVTELQETMALVLECLRAYGFVKRPL